MPKFAIWPIRRVGATGPDVLIHPGKRHRVGPRAVQSAVGEQALGVQHVPDNLADRPLAGRVREGLVDRSDSREQHLEVAGVVETEVRYQFVRRWAVLAFAGVGFTNERTMANETEDDINAYGIGVRYLALPEQNVWIGLDVAQGPENKAFYIQMTHPW